MHLLNEEILAEIYFHGKRSTYKQMIRTQILRREVEYFFMRFGKMSRRLDHESETLLLFFCFVFLVNNMNDYNIRE